MSRLTYKVSYYVLYVLFAVIAVVLGLFYLGGEMTAKIVPDMSNPAYTDTMLYLIYGLVGLTILITVVAFLIQFGGELKDHPVDALKSLIGVILLVAVLFITYSIGDDKTLNIVGFEGTDNSNPFILKLTDMFLYTLYLLTGLAIVAMIFSAIKKALS